MQDTQELVTIVNSSADVWVGKGRKENRFFK